MNKGFTLIELIGTVVILAVISLIAFPAILNLLNSSNDTLDDKTKEFINSAALEYANDNKDEFTSPITVEGLVNKGYLASNIVCDNCELANDVIEINYNNGKFTATYNEKDGETCPTSCQ